MVIAADIFLNSERLRLRRFQKQDGPAVQRLAGIAEIADTTLLIPHPYPDGAAEAFIESTHADWDKGEQYVFAITLSESGELCGSIGLKVSEKHERGELGYWIGVPFWNRGYCTEAGRTVLKFAFEELKLNTVVAHHFLRNPASGRVLQKLGMKYEGRLRQHVKKGDHFEDLECWAAQSTLNLDCKKPGAVSNPRMKSPLGVLCWALMGVFISSAVADECLVYLGTYTGPKSKGIYVSRLDRNKGELSAPELAAETRSPSFLAIHPNGKFLYAVGEVNNFGGKKAGSISAFSIDRKSGKLTALNQQTSGGDGPCHLVVDRTGKYALAANYGGGSVTAVAIKEDGSLGEVTAFIQHTGSSVNPQRQKEPHGHSINVDQGNRFAVAADLGLDKLLVYRLDQKTGKLEANDPPFASVKAGAGPRHFAFHPKGENAYVINEMDCTVTAFEWDGKKGVLKETQTISTLPPGEEVKRGFSTAEVQAHPSGKFVYGSNRGHDSIVVYATERDGKLKYVENEPTGGKTPRNFGIDPRGQYLLAANQSSDSVVVFSIDEKTGALTPTGNRIEAPTPVCVKFLEVK